jgi:uncharacterized protein (TIGR02145 family)
MKTKRIYLLYVAVVMLFMFTTAKSYALNYTISFTASGASTIIDSVIVNNSIVVPNGYVIRLSNTQQNNTSGVVNVNYNIGDRLLFKAVSGNYTTIFSEQFESDKSVNVEFVECKDGDGNYYPIVKIGEQIWMAENLKTTKYNDNSDITYIADNNSWSNSTYNESIPAYCWYNNDIIINTNGFGVIYPVVQSYRRAYGGLYNWFAVNTHKLSPLGWHVSTSDDWSVLTNYVGGQSTAGYYLKSENGWYDEYGNSNGNGINKYGFSALPGGYRTSFGFSSVSMDAIYVMSDKYSLAQVWGCDISYGSGQAFIQSFIHVTNGASIRCVKNKIPTITTKSPMNITKNSFSSGGENINDGGEFILHKGICWSTNENPTIMDNTTDNGTDNGEFYTGISELLPNTTYYLKAYVTSYIGTSYGNEITVTTESTELLYFRSKQSGNSNVVTSWESSTDNSNWIPATSIPTVSVTSVTILDGHSISVNNNLTLSNLTLNSGSTLNINSNCRLNVISSMTNNGTINLLSDATGTASIITPAIISGTGTTNVQQYVTTGRNWYISSPVTGGTSATFNAVNSENVVYWYDESKGNNTPWQQISDNNTILNPMKGYVYSPASTGVVTFTGVLNTGTKEITVNRTVGQTDEGFNLIGNPYASYLDWSKVNRGNLTSSMWYRTKTIPAPVTGSTAYVFDTYNVLSNIATNNGAKPMTKMIPPMQAFWVRVANGQSQATITTNNAHRGFIDISNNGFRTKAENSNTTQPTLRLDLSNGTYSDQAIIYINALASNNIDDFDSQKMFNSSATLAEIYSLSGSKELAINGLKNIPFDNELLLGFKTATSGTFNIKASEYSNFEPGIQAILKDKVTNSVFDLSGGGLYNFTSDATNNNTNRFSIIFHASSLATNLNTNTNKSVWFSTNSNRELILNGTPNDGTVLEVFNTVGEKIISKSLNKNSNLNGIILQSGVYLINMTQNGQKTTQKIIMK